MQANQTVVSFRPGGGFGGLRGNRFLTPRFNSSSSLSEALTLRPNGGLAPTLKVGTAPALVKAEVPWFAQRGNLPEKECFLKKVKGSFWNKMLKQAQQRRMLIQGP
ncbi:uncharacterized protein LOC132189309 isoform X2 [Corylus avellana]|uniref:uncharacterized protein LOC132189309 isoform X2 n=1 Tax=Corylus avellana TaxID=13451 RepID=UPI00286B8B16|nr:uncharacterized protein LOC132189309 isoform X2 [Corylus avellana]